MSGHSKWHSIKHKKALVDAKRGKAFTKIIKELQIAARMGGSDPGGNPRLRTAIQGAKDANLPKDTMERAIKKGAGELEGSSFEELHYEGYGPGGVAIMVKVTTDNRNRAASDIRHVFSKNGGNLGADGCVGFLFTREGTIIVDEGDEDAVMEAALEAGAKDVEAEDGAYLVKTEPDSTQDVRDALEKAGFKVSSSENAYHASVHVRLEGKDAVACAKLLAMLDDNDDVDEVAHNLEATDEVMNIVAGH